MRWDSSSIEFTSPIWYDKLPRSAIMVVNIRPDLHKPHPESNWPSAVHQWPPQMEILNAQQEWRDLTSLEWYYWGRGLDRPPRSDLSDVHTVGNVPVSFPSCSISKVPPRQILRIRRATGIKSLKCSPLEETYLTSKSVTSARLQIFCDLWF